MPRTDNRCNSCRRSSTGRCARHQREATSAALFGVVPVAPSPVAERPPRVRWWQVPSGWVMAGGR